MIDNVIFTDENGISKSAYDDFGLIMVSKVIEAPPPKLHEIDIPGADDTKDLSEYLTGSIKFQKRNINLKFRYLGPQNTRSAVNSELLNFAHGKIITFNFSDDLDYIYIGRTITNVPTVKKNKAFDFEISAVANSHKRDIASSAEEWLWDPFDFELGVINELSNIDLPANEYIGYTIVGTYEDYPVLTTGAASVQVWYDVRPDVAPSVTPQWTIPANTERRLYDCKILTGEHWFTFKAVGADSTITVDYRGGML